MACLPLSSALAPCSYSPNQHPCKTAPALIPMTLQPPSLTASQLLMLRLPSRCSKSQLLMPPAAPHGTFGMSQALGCAANRVY